MATTWIDTVHINSEHSYAYTINECIKYIVDPEKTDGGRFYTEIQTQNNKFYAVKNSKWKYLNELNKARKNIETICSNSVPLEQRGEYKKEQKKKREQRASMQFGNR